MSYITLFTINYTIKKIKYEIMVSKQFSTLWHLTNKLLIPYYLL